MGKTVSTSADSKDSPAKARKVTKVKEHIVEILSDSGEGAQTAGQTFATISAKMGNSIWTVEIIPAEIEPPARSIAGASGNRIRLGSFRVTNAGNKADLVVALNEQVLLGRVRADEINLGAHILLESAWKSHKDPEIVKAYNAAVEDLAAKGYRIIEVPMHHECLRIVDNPQRGKNIFLVGLLCSLYTRDIQLAREQVEFVFRRKGAAVVESNLKLLEAGYTWAERNLDFGFTVPPYGLKESQIVVNGNTAVGLGIMASGMEVCAMYPITPATSVTHYLSEVFRNVGGMIHQAEDEIAACGFAIGASYAGKCAVTVTSGPGMALKTEFMGLAIMAEIPLVLVNVQRGGPSTGLPTKVEQGDLLAAIFGTPGDAPKVVLAPSTIEDCFYSIITARKIAEAFRTLVIVLTDANLATGQQAFTTPKFKEEWTAPAFDQNPVPGGKDPYDWDSTTGLSQRFIPGQPGGIFTLTGLAHDRHSRIAYDPGANQEGCRHRSQKLAALQKTLKTPKVVGEPQGDLLVVGWGSTRGAIEEAVQNARADGLKVSALHIKFLQPMASGIGDILRRFKAVICVEINYSDSPNAELIGSENRRYSNLAWLLRARCLVDVDSWSNVHGQPIKPGAIEGMIREKVQKIKD